MTLKEARERLIRNLIEKKFLKTEKVIQAVREVPRELFVPEKFKKFAYADNPLPIGIGQTISAPHMVAVMTELLEPKKTDKVLEIGAGSGYHAAILSKLVKMVYTIELEHDLVISARKALQKCGCKNVEIIEGDGNEGYEQAAPYDKIIITCAAQEIPKRLVAQLKDGGRFVAPLGGTFVQELVVGTKKGEELILETHFNCVFVPMRKGKK